MDIVLKLRELRRGLNLTQKQVAKLSGIGLKTISAFETGMRISSLKVNQLLRLLKVYGISPSKFFSPEFEEELENGLNAEEKSHEPGERELGKKQFDRGLDDGRKGRRMISFTRSYLSGYVQGIERRREGV